LLKSNANVYILFLFTNCNAQFFKFIAACKKCDPGWGKPQRGAAEINNKRDGVGKRQKGCAIPEV